MCVFVGDLFEIQIITFNFNMIIGIQQTVSIILNHHVILHIDDIRKQIFNKITL